MTNADLAILSLIVEHPRHGYEIEQIILERGLRDWTEIGFSSIYFVLKKLKVNGWIKGQAEPAAGRGPARLVYQATAAGKAAWRQAALEALAATNPRPMPFLTGLANLPQLPPAQALAALQTHQTSLTERRAQVRAQWAAARDAARPAPAPMAAIFELSLALIEAELKWVEKFIRTLDSQDY